MAGYATKESIMRSLRKENQELREYIVYLQNQTKELNSIVQQQNELINKMNLENVDRVLSK